MKSLLNEAATYLVNRLTVSDFNIVLKELILGSFHDAFIMQLGK